ncbi:PDR/VanB family oxidoreductase [Actinacidiphila sp. DG2A-62]|uniref:PDR/VanB family oxidoreductase n=1 Tax=Actinacidiphila sp. DG2A-62 TaxID=3108821 RepID=UPI002DBE6B16|nr:PDR/VanB family oxidoreductase [Actinacidiphila sp. DG2A-62]MEC3998115.1 PDR/VanB family oxidoreductase [Actinacidiphila sp. DG2A-62]
MNDTIDLVVADRREEAVGVVSLTLRQADGRALPDWQPGAHVDLLLAEGLERSYSLCGVPGAARWRIAVLREADGRGGSDFVHDRLRAGDRLRARGPRNHFALEPAPHHRFVAGGIGITPILPMLAAASAAASDWSLLYGGRSRSRMAFVEELTRGHPAERVTLTTGRLDLDAHLAGLRPGELVYACGPASLLADVADRVPASALRTELFTAAPADASGDTAFEVELARSGVVLTVPPDRSVLRTLQRAGVDVLYSCAEGTCGTCETDVLAGEVDHRDSVLTDAERAAGETMMVCVSRCRTPGGRLTLDL